MKKMLALLLLAMLTLASERSPANAENVLFIIDFSGSMKRAVDGRPMIAIAKDVFRKTLQDIPASAKVGLMLYGHRRAKDCRDIELVARLGQQPPLTLADRIEPLEARGETPIATSLLQAVNVFNGLKGEKNSVVLITDGKEECNGDPCAAASALSSAGLDVNVHVVGFRLSDEERQAVACISANTGGRYFDAQDASALSSALASVRQSVAQAAPPPAPPPAAKPERINLLAKRNGGEVIVSPHERWEGSNDDQLNRIGSDPYYAFRANDEVVYAFKAEASAKLEAFATYIPATSANTPKEIELLASDDSPAGPFRSLGVMTTLNAKLRDGWQELKLPDGSTAKFFKVKLLTSHGDGLELHEFRLFGELTQTSAPAAAAASKSRSNLLSQAQGGNIVVSPHERWAGSNDDKLTRVGSDPYYAFKANDEAVYAFRGGLTGKLDSFAIYIPATSSSTPREIELLASNDGPAGPFHSLGAMTTLNAKLRDGWQELKLPDGSTAKFFKVKLLSSHGDGFEVYEFRLFGELTQTAAATPSAAAAPAKPRVNLLSQGQGGDLIVSPHDRWTGSNDDKLVRVGSDPAYAFKVNDEAVYAFRGERSASLETFAIYIPASSSSTPKEIELSASDGGPGGPFRTFGTMTTINAKVRDGWQDFALPAGATAKYFKVKLVSSHGDGLELYEFRLFGELK